MHRSVLFQEVCEALRPSTGQVFMDGTFGAGGHSTAIAQAIGSTGHLVSFDADSTVFEKPVSEVVGTLTQFHPIVANFRTAGEVLPKLGLTLHGALFDLGLSSTQLEVSGRGFTFQKDEPLAMTFRSDPDEDTVTANSIVNTWSEDTIATILRGFADEPFAGRIARHIVEKRRLMHIKTTGQLVEIILEATPKRFHHGRTHPATRTFQALRMAVNDELGAVTDGLSAALTHMHPGGRIAVITFHSIEDRTVKQYFKDAVSRGECIAVTKKPIVPTSEEVASNPRARSAKLRIVEKVHNNQFQNISS
jgi:16S rRNA (cytosine1402-N4)-methyltransferase